MIIRLPVLVAALGIGLGAVNCRAEEGRSSWNESLAVSITVGAVLGASTLPFYEQPGKHIKNIAYGASMGAVVGIGIIISGLFLGSDEPEEYACFIDSLHHRRDPHIPLETAVPPHTQLVSLSF